MTFAASVPSGRLGNSAFRRRPSTHRNREPSAPPIPTARIDRYMSEGKRSGRNQGQTSARRAKDAQGRNDNGAHHAVADTESAAPPFMHNTGRISFAPRLPSYPSPCPHESRQPRRQRNRHAAAALPHPSL